VTRIYLPQLSPPRTVVVALVMAWIVIAAIPSVDAALEWLIIAIADRFTNPANHVKMPE
jgi:hypothetical protein